MIADRRSSTRNQRLAVVPISHIAQVLWMLSHHARIAGDTVAPHAPRSSLATESFFFKFSGSKHLFLSFLKDLGSIFFEKIDLVASDALGTRGACAVRRSSVTASPLKRWSQVVAP